VDRLTERSERFSEPARDALRRAIDLREAMHDVFWAIMNRRAAGGCVSATERRSSRGG
jgi:hypothetical protein